MPIRRCAGLRFRPQVCAPIMVTNPPQLESISMIQNKTPKYCSILAMLFVIPALLVACAKQPETDLAPLDQMPAEVQNAPVKVQQAYQFAIANPQIMQQVSCYCGCGKMGHTSNYSCYAKGQAADGKINFDTHALGCSICVDITQDTMRLLKEGKTVPEIKAFVDQTYSQYGSSNMP
jgi:hypothetical protein